jgi:hypothetical protein
MHRIIRKRPYCIRWTLHDALIFHEEMQSKSGIKHIIMECAKLLFYTAEENLELSTVWLELSLPNLPESKSERNGVEGDYLNKLS